MPTTGSGKFRYPNSSDTPDVPGDILNLATDVARVAGAGIGYVADSTERAALVTNGYAFSGMFVLQADTGVTYRYTGSAWKIWDYPLTAFTPTVTGIAQGTTGTIGAYKCAAGGVAHIYYSLAFDGSSMSYPNNDETRGFDLPSDLLPNSNLTSINRQFAATAFYTDVSEATTSAARRIELGAMVSVDNGLAASRLVVFRKNAPSTNDTIQHSRTNTGVPTPAAGDTISAEVHYPL